MKEFITKFKIYRKFKGGKWFFVSESKQGIGKFGYYFTIAHYYWTQNKPLKNENILLIENYK